MLSQYLYISTAPSLSRDEIEGILEASARKNPLCEITGLLLYNGRNFLQLLEGKEAELINLMVRITHDPRHSGVSMLDRRSVDARACPEWAMRRIAIAKNVEERRAILETDLPDALDPELRKIVLNFAILN